MIGHGGRSVRQLPTHGFAITQSAAAFEAGGCDLAERLMLALEAGAQHGEGDARCKERGIPSDSAFIEVDLPQEPAGSYLKLSVAGTRSLHCDVSSMSGA